MWRSLLKIEFLEAYMNNYPIGAYIFLVLKKHFKENSKLFAVTIALFILMGCVSIPVIIKTSSDLLKFKPKEIVIQNEDIINGVNMDSIMVSGKFVEYKNSVVTVEKSVSSSNEEIVKINMNLSAKTDIIIKSIDEEFFLGNVTKEIVTYYKLTVDDFVQNYSDYIKRPVNIWSEDDLNIDTLIIWVWND